MRFLDFPEGDDFWLVKWYDRYTQSHALSRSPSFQVLLERIPINSARELGLLDRLSIGSHLARQDTDGGFRTVRVLTGSLPLIRIGQVYRRKTRAGNLPTTELALDMPGGENLFSEVELGHELEKPAKWDKPYRLLNPSQYGLPKRSYDGSRCIVRRIAMPGYEMDVVIPRILIEQTFYFPDTLMANAAATGSWSSYREQLILDKRLNTGLETGICPQTGNWKVLLRTRVRDRYAPLMALFAHSEYAARSAESIYAQATVERGSGRFNPWHASGQIPFDPDLGSYKLRLRGINLRSVGLKGAETFLATHISGISLPERMPMVEWERENSGRDSNNGHRSPDAPRGGRSQGRGTPNRPLKSTVDPDPHQGDEGFDGVSIGWIDPPRCRKQEKTSHTVHEGERRRPSRAAQSSEASTGADSGQKGNPGKASGHTPLLPPSNAFRELERCLNQLVDRGVISQWFVVDPGDDARREGREGLDCWNFLPDELRKNEQKERRLPRRGWYILNPRNDTPRARAGLVVEIEMNERVVHWIEIERREAERGMRSPVLVDVPEHLSDWAIDTALGQISAAAGTGLRRLVERVAQSVGMGVSGRLYEHQYEGARVKKTAQTAGTSPNEADSDRDSEGTKSRAWNVDSVARFLGDLMG